MVRRSMDFTITDEFEIDMGDLTEEETRRLLGWLDGEVDDSEVDDVIVGFGGVEVDMQQVDGTDPALTYEGDVHYTKADR